jgi:hypothetical protein
MSRERQANRCQEDRLPGITSMRLAYRGLDSWEEMAEILAGRAEIIGLRQRERLSHCLCQMKEGRLPSGGQFDQDPRAGCCILKSLQIGEMHAKVPALR